MSDQEIVDLADKAGITFVTQSGVASATVEWLQKFAALVSAREREECAKIVEFYLKYYPDYVTGATQEIRTRGEK